ncbi:hypothetical protein [Streptomyces sp. SID1121]|uniref:hypothetical protein n=1 Tax=Streptomyces sp. SID1121 TaxID=3425888 RepID=UPI004055BE1F
MSVIERVPSVEFRVELPKWVGSNRWVWEPAGPGFPPMPDYIRNAHELDRALYVYAVAVANLAANEVHRFRVVAYRYDTCAPTGIHEWITSEDSGRLVPSGAPWVLWQDVPEPERCPA